MSATRIALVLIILIADASISSAQLLPRRRAATQRAIQQAVEKQAFEWAGKVIEEEIKKGLKGIFDEAGFIFDLELSVLLYAQLSMDPQAKTRLETISNPNSQEKLTKDLMGNGCAKLFLSETAKYAESLSSEKFTSPVLDKINVEYESNDGIPLNDGTLKKERSRQITLDNSLFQENKVLKKEQREHFVTYHETVRPIDPKNKAAFTVHCSFEFLTQKDGKEFRKTLSFALYLEELKKTGDVLGYPWKVKDVQYK